MLIRSAREHLLDINSKACDTIHFLKNMNLSGSFGGQTSTKYVELRQEVLTIRVSVNLAWLTSSNMLRLQHGASKCCAAHPSKRDARCKEGKLVVRRPVRILRHLYAVPSRHNHQNALVIRDRIFAFTGLCNDADDPVPRSNRAFALSSLGTQHPRTIYFPPKTYKEESSRPPEVFESL
jgi:hypothetical protein